jgi:hypothetical protein
MTHPSSPSVRVLKERGPNGSGRHSQKSVPCYITYIKPPKEDFPDFLRGLADILKSQCPATFNI